MQVARMQIGLANLTEVAIRRLEAARRDGVKKLILVGDQSVILGMAVRDGVPPIELVDGDQLVGLFEEMELGLRAKTTYDVDVAFFDPYRS